MVHVNSADPSGGLNIQYVTYCMFEVKKASEEFLTPPESNASTDIDENEFKRKTISTQTEILHKTQSSQVKF